jgi:hypothetical protein
MVFGMKYQMNRKNNALGLLLMAFVLLPIAVIVTFASCNVEKKDKIASPQIPYPDAAFAKYLQGQVDSSQFIWFTDLKAAASAFCNDQIPHEGDGISTASMDILSESLFRGKVEVRLPDKKLLILTMERPFKERGVNSIWQVTAMEEKDWPKEKSK